MIDACRDARDAGGALASCAPRLRRLFAPDGRCLDIALDHGVFGEPSFLKGIEDLPGAVRALLPAAPDAIQLTPGTAALLQEAPGRGRPALVLRADAANVYGTPLPPDPFCLLEGDPVEQALSLDAACLVANLLSLPGQTRLTAQCIANIQRLKPACERFGMPLMVEPLAMKPGPAGTHGVDGDVSRIATLVRQAVELGADLIKADPCDNLEEYPRVLEAACGRPVLVRGGGRSDDAILLDRTARTMRLGASGIVYGRNIVQHRDPVAMTRALMAVVHDGADPARAASLLRP